MLCMVEAAILLIGAFWCGNYANLIAANNGLRDLWRCSREIQKSAMNRTAAKLE